MGVFTYLLQVGRCILQQILYRFLAHHLLPGFHLLLFPLFCHAVQLKHDLAGLQDQMQTDVLGITGAMPPVLLQPCKNLLQLAQGALTVS
ncbi:hypothetical protein D3C75_751950 [compost metagenome]